MTDHNQHHGRPETISVDELHTLVALDRDWVFDPGRRCIRRLDERFFEVRWFDRGAFGQPGI